MKTLVIAEPGCTHEGDKATLLRLLETAHQCGADVFKPQWTSDVLHMCRRRHIDGGHPKRAYYLKAYSWLAFPVKWHREFSERCHVLGMQYAVTCFLPQDVATVALWVDYLKISSFEAGDAAMLQAVQGMTPQVIISAGMNTDPADLGVDASVLHCVSAYPAPLAAMNLRCISKDEWPYGCRGHEGLSDHSRHLLTGALAVACGAEMIETHYRLDDCNPENPDYPVAFAPAEFTQYIQNIRDAELMVGDGIKRVQPCEAEMLPYRVTA